MQAGLVRDAMLRRVRERTAVAGTVRWPAVPALLDEYTDMVSRLFTAVGRSFAGGERDAARATLEARLSEAFAGSQRSKLALNFQAEPGAPLGYEINAQISSIADAYSRWVGTSDAPLFGAHPDARVLAAARELGEPGSVKVLDLGAGTGRNALALARLGHPVTAVEITASFAEILAQTAGDEALPVRVVVDDVFSSNAALGRDFRLFIASEVVPDFRSQDELAALFRLAAEVLTEGGLLVLNLHQSLQGYTPEKSARQFAQQCYSALFTPGEVAAALAGLPLELIDSQAAYDYEREHLPRGAWPPTPWYENWAAGLDVYELERESSPVELCWLVLRRRANAEAESLPARNNALASLAQKKRRKAPELLRAALLRRFRSRCVASGVLTLPAVPALLDHYVELLVGIFTALGREVARGERDDARRLLAQALEQAFLASPRSNIVVTYELPMGPDLSYTVTTDPVPLSAVYEQWLETLPPPLFGAHADARVVSLFERLGEPAANPVLDLGAGLGRNALALARRGHPVDAVDVTKTFMHELTRAAANEKLAIMTHVADVLERTPERARGYRLVLAAGLAGDFRGVADLRRLFELAAEVLAVGGLFLLSVHVASDAYAPDRAAREWAQQSSALFFTRAELDLARRGLGFELEADDSAYDYELTHLPEHEFPPTPVFAEWALCEHLFALEPGQRIVELRWLSFVKVS